MQNNTLRGERLLNRCKLAGALLCAVAALPAHAADAPYPTRPIRAIVGFVPGGATDILARALAQKLTDSLGQQVIVDNRAGGGGVIAGMMAKEAPADGHTLFFGTISTLATNVATKRSLPYDPLKDFTPITLTVSNPYFMVVHPGVPAATTQEFINFARARAGAVNFASSGTGGGAHLAVEMFASMAKTPMVHVPYKGAAQGTTDVIAGHIQMTFAQPPVMLSHAKAGRLKVLGVTSRKRLSSWPDAPPIADAVPGYEATSWQGVLVPVNTPKPIVTRLHTEIVKALNAADLRPRLVAEGSEISGMPPEEFREYIRAEIGKWTRVVRDAKLTIE
jgi:tripartite-type tricarboxylate transporter receptor subunit TctC